MSLKVKRIVALCVCCVLLGAAVVQNLRSSAVSAGQGSVDQPVDQPDTGGTGNGNENDDPVSQPEEDRLVAEFFSGARLERESNRSMQEEACQTILSSAESSAEEKTAAQETVQVLSLRSEVELTLENAIKSRGYEDVFVLLDDSGAVDVTVWAESLAEEEVMILASLILDNTEAEMDQIVVQSIA